MKEYFRFAYDHGGVVTLSRHLNNPLTGKTAWDPVPGTVASILPGAEKNELYKSWLDKVAAFFLNLKGRNGELIPIIFRPFHELNGNWFWWGEKWCTPRNINRLTSLPYPIYEIQKAFIIFYTPITQTVLVQKKNT
jgi:hypothetical protein